ncbi:MAG: hypothetical protein WD557_08860 [Dehalococcoidia bacterium]
MALATFRRSFRRWRVARAIRAAREQGHGLYFTEWQSSPASAETLARDVTQWCRDTVARCRRPNGIDHFDLTLTFHSTGGPRTQRLAFLRPGQLYDESVVPAALSAALAAFAVGDPETTVRVAAALLSWGDVAFASMS